ncbi:MAG: hypothetical protein CMB07_04800 [Euryarchaeota archaeon]|nr:hypothetical protein [Euryarchaeota archaeon]|tara:strand:+ start:739 stop:1590 length:852 start_codon:yes stop_codon:yes gene_type:complete
MLKLSPLRRDILRLSRSISEGDIAFAVNLSEELLNRSRGSEERDIEAEARIRLDRALIGAVEESMVGAELRWATERMSSIHPGSPGHALALLNLAGWHASSGESMMALAIHSEITSLAGHPNDLIALSRLEVGRLHLGLGDDESALRHLWSSASKFESEEMHGEEAIALLEWLDIALDILSLEARTMHEVIRDAAPRDPKNKTTAMAHPEDALKVAMRLAETILEDLSGSQRPDLGLLVDAAFCLKSVTLAELLASKSEDIEDTEVVKWIQELNLNDSESDQS